MGSTVLRRSTLHGLAWRSHVSSSSAKARAIFRSSVIGYLLWLRREYFFMAGQRVFPTEDPDHTPGQHINTRFALMHHYKGVIDLTAGKPRLMTTVSILTRRLREGKTYEDFRKAWFHTTGFGVEGKVEVTGRSDGKTTLLSSGQQVGATGSGLGTPASFDAKNELDQCTPNSKQAITNEYSDIDRLVYPDWQARDSGFDNNRDRDHKPFRKNQQSIFILQSDPDFHVKIDQRF
jgi:hypothetical protein